MPVGAAGIIAPNAALSWPGAGANLYIDLVERGPDREQPAKRLDAAAGRTASPEWLRRHLGTAPTAYLEGALQNPVLTERELALLLRNPRLRPEHLGRLGRQRRWTRFYEIRKALVRHPCTPLAVSRSLLPHLFWKDLADVSWDAQAHPVVRRHSEAILRGRLDELAVGERVTLARRATRGLIDSLVESADVRVLQSLLSNSRLVEPDAVRIASQEPTPRSLLDYMARHPRWGVRREVRLALLRNPRTPVPAALYLIARLPLRDLQRLAGDGKVPKIVRIGADRRAQRATRRVNSRGGRHPMNRSTSSDRSPRRIDD
jgi:hypothetical protein